MANKIICAAVVKQDEVYNVDNLIVFDGLSAIDGVREAMGYDFLLPVEDGKVLIGDSYDAENDVFLRDGERVYPELSDKERLDALEQAQNNTDAALIELAQMISGGI